MTSVIIIRKLFPNQSGACKHAYCRCGSERATWHSQVERSTVQNSCAMRMADLFIVATRGDVCNVATLHIMGRAEEAEVAWALATRALSSCGTWTLPADILPPHDATLMPHDSCPPSRCCGSALNAQRPPSALLLCVC